MQKWLQVRAAHHSNRIVQVADQRSGGVSLDDEMKVCDDGACEQAQTASDTVVVVKVGAHCMELLLSIQERVVCSHLRAHAPVTYQKKPRSWLRLRRPLGTDAEPKSRVYTPETQTQQAQLHNLDTFNCCKGGHAFTMHLPDIYVTSITASTRT